MKFKENIEMQFKIDPELRDIYKNAVLSQKNVEAIHKECYDRIVLCRNPVETAINDKLVLKENLIEKCENLFQLSPCTLKLVYSPSELQYFTDIHILSGDGCMVLNSSPVILTNCITKSMLENALVIYQKSDWSPCSSLEKLIIEKYTDKIIITDDCKNELLLPFSGKYRINSIIDVGQEYISINTLNYINFEFEKLNDKNETSSEQYSRILRNTFIKEFENGFKRIFLDGEEIFKDFSMDVLFTGCYISVECFKKANVKFSREIEKKCSEAAKRITNQTSNIKRKTQRNNEVRVMEDYTNRFLCDLKEEIEKQWRKIVCDI